MSEDAPGWLSKIDDDAPRRRVADELRQKYRVGFHVFRVGERTWCAVGPYYDRSTGRCGLGTTPEAAVQAHLTRRELQQAKITFADFEVHE